MLHAQGIIAYLALLVLSLSSILAAIIPPLLNQDQPGLDTDTIAFGQDSDRTVLDICPELNVKCVVDGDWRHPIGYLGKKRMSKTIVQRCQR
jgi:hypothetical protein